MFNHNDDPENSTEADFDRFKEILTKNPSLINIENQNGQSVFWLICAYGQRKHVEFSLKEPVKSALDHLKTDAWKRDALEAAEHFQHKSVIELLNPVFGVGVHPYKNGIDPPEI